MNLVQMSRSLRSFLFMAATPGAERTTAVPARARGRRPVQARVEAFERGVALKLELVPDALKGRPSASLRSGCRPPPRSRRASRPWRSSAAAAGSRGPSRTMAASSSTKLALLFLSERFRWRCTQPARRRAHPRPVHSSRAPRSAEARVLRLKGFSRTLRVAAVAARISIELVEIDVRDTPPGPRFPGASSFRLGVPHPVGPIWPLHQEGRARRRSTPDPSLSGSRCLSPLCRAVCGNHLHFL